MVEVSSDDDLHETDWVYPPWNILELVEGTILGNDRKPMEPHGSLNELGVKTC